MPDHGQFYLHGTLRLSGQLGAQLPHRLIPELLFRRGGREYVTVIARKHPRIGLPVAHLILPSLRIFECVVTRRVGLHRRNIQERRSDGILQWRLSEEPSGLFNSSLEGNARRAIDFHEGA